MARSESSHEPPEGRSDSLRLRTLLVASVVSGGIFLAYLYPVPFTLIPRSRWVPLILGAFASTALSLGFGAVFWYADVASATRNGALVFCIGGLGWLLSEPRAGARVLFLLLATLTYWTLLQLGLHLVERSGPFYLWRIRPRFGPLLLIWLPTTPFVAWVLASRPRTVP